MKNIGHPNMFPDVAGAAAPLDAHIATDADAGGITDASTSGNPWANSRATC